MKLGRGSRERLEGFKTGEAEKDDVGRTKSVVALRYEGDEAVFDSIVRCSDVDFVKGRP